MVASADAQAKLMEAVHMTKTERGETVKACPYCGAPMVWVKSKSGKYMPIDAFNTVTVCLEKDGIGTVTAGRTVHFNTCPQREKWYEHT